MRSLLDVNVLIALFDAAHVFHSRAHAWWSSNASEGWASCPLTENGFIRILSHRGYSKQVQLAPGDLVSRLTRFAADTDHRFWPDDLTFRDAAVFRLERLHSSKQVTDAYLLGLASRNGGRFATLDETIDASIVHGARNDFLYVIP